MTRRSRVLVAAAAALALASCSTGTVSCGGCPGQVVVNLVAATATPRPSPSGTVETGTAPSGLPSQPSSPATDQRTEVRVCISGIPCVDQTWAGGSLMPRLPGRVDTSSLGGREVTVSYRHPTSGEAVTTRGRLAYHDGGSGQCSCSYAYAGLPLAP